LGPDGTLTTLAHTTHPDAVTTATLNPKHSETHTALTALATAHTHGHHLTWPTGGSTVNLPTYAFQHHPYWLEPRPVSGALAADGVLWDAVTHGDEEALAELLTLDPDQRKALGSVLPALADWFSARTAPAPVADFADEEEDEAALPSLRDRLAGAQAEEVERVLLETVLRYTAEVLGLDSAEQVDPLLEFLDLGLSSFTAMELSKRLGEDGLELEPVAIYDHPTPGELAEHLRTTL
jgi:acyl transferase domain-containing protein